MSVLIEAVSLVVPRRLLDQGFPGGTRGFLAELSRPSAENRHVCADAHLLCVSFFVTEAAHRTAAVLARVGMTESRNGSYVDFAIMDQHSGPLLECPWLEWTREPAGYSCAWLADAERGEMAVPSEWSADASRRLSRIDAMESDTFVLSREDGIETWLDLRTGRIGKTERTPT